MSFHYSLLATPCVTEVAAVSRRPEQASTGDSSDRDCGIQGMCFPNKAAFYFIFMLIGFGSLSHQKQLYNMCRQTQKGSHIHTHTKRNVHYEQTSVCMRAVEGVLLYSFLLSLSKVQCVCSVCVPCRVCTRRRNSLAAWSFSPADLK